MMRASTLAAAALIFTLPSSGRAAFSQEPLPESLTGKVLSVADGDMITVLKDFSTELVRNPLAWCRRKYAPNERPLAIRTRKETTRWN